MLAVGLFVVLLGSVAHATNDSLKVSFHHRPGCRSERCDHRVDVIWARHHQPPAPPMQEGVASWFEDGGATACGTHYALGFAHLPGMACGTRVLFCAARCAIGTREDSGPYVAGRDWDLNAALKAALGCSDLCTVRTRVLP